MILLLHDLSFAARFCNRLLLIHRGRLAADGAPQAVPTNAMLAEVYGIAA